jgi:hypothetical protein
LTPVPLSKLTTQQSVRYKALKALETPETKGSFFFTDADLAACTAIRPDATGKAVLQVLRHAGVLREVRGGGVTRYIVCTPEAAE